MPRVLYTIVNSSHTRDAEPRATVPLPGLTGGALLLLGRQGTAKPGPAVSWAAQSVDCTSRMSVSSRWL